VKVTGIKRIKFPENELSNYYSSGGHTFYDRSSLINEIVFNSWSTIELWYIDRCSCAVNYEASIQAAQEKFFS